MFHYKVVTCFTSSNQRLDVFNSLFGKESVYLDGVLHSQRSSIFGSQHCFNNNTSNFVINIGYKYPLRIGFDIYENGKIIVQS